jgi:hypothetical protein
MKVEKIKRELLAEHQLLRGLLDIVRGLAEKVAANDASLMPALRNAVLQLTQALIKHMDSEEQHLAALSRGGNPHWAQHLTEFKHQHVHQRSLLAHFIERVESIHASKRLGEVIQAMVGAIQLDMEHEEKALFAPESATSHAKSV